MTQPAAPVSTWKLLGGGSTSSAERRDRSRRDAVEFLPEPTQRERYWPIFSVDDHIVEPPGMFEGRLPKGLQDRAPWVIEDEFGDQMWLLEGRRIANIGLSAVAGLVDSSWTTNPTRFDEMRRGCWDVNERVHDMDLAGIYASLSFPSHLPGFAGRVFAKLKDAELGLALVRAWNDWHIEEWAGAYPDRFIPCQLPWLGDPTVAAEEIRANASRGFRAVTFTENPVNHGLPSLHSQHWDAFLHACVETDTVICLHGASSGWTAVQAEDAPLGEFTTMFVINAMTATIDWMWSGIPARFPTAKIVMSESGISWIPAILERLDYVLTHSVKSDRESFPGGGLTPREIVDRNFWFSSLFDPAGIELRNDIGVANIMLESDYPHSDSSWPDTQEVCHRLLRDIPSSEAWAIACANASDLFRHPLPRNDGVQWNATARTASGPAQGDPS